MRKNTAKIRRVRRRIALCLPLNLRVRLKQKLNRCLDPEEAKYLKGEVLRKAEKNIKNTTKRVLFWIPGGMPAINNVEASIAMALKLRGVKAHMVICDGALSGCMQRNIIKDVPKIKWSEKCPDCFQKCLEAIQSFDLPCDGIGNFVSEKNCLELRQIAQNTNLNKVFSFQYRGVDVGRYAVSSAIRYLRGKSIDGHDSILREYLYSGLVTTEGAIKCINKFKPHLIFMSHRIYVDWGPALSAALKDGIPVIGWMSAYLKDHFYLHTVKPEKDLDLSKIEGINAMSAEAWNKRKRKPLGKKENAKLDGFFKTRYSKNNAFDIGKNHTPPAGKKEILQKLCISEKKPIWVIFAHMKWDGVFNYTPMLYERVTRWLIETIQTIKELRNITWLLKIHPAESWLPAASDTYTMIKEAFPELPTHIRVIPSDSSINPFSLYSILSGGIAIFGTAGLELTLQGKPVILAGKSHYATKGFTHDPETKSEYLQLLRNTATLPPLSVAQLALARQYAYSFFIQRQIPMPKLIRTKGDAWWQVDFNKLDMLLPGKDPALDMVCNKIINGGDFILE